MFTNRVFIFLQLCSIKILGVNLVVVPASNIFDAVAQTALRLDSSEIFAGHSAKMSEQEQARNLGRAWERLPEAPYRQACFRILGPRGSEQAFYLGAHAPRFTEDDIGLIHKIWIEVSKVPARRKVHHRDVVRVALDRLERDLRGQSEVMLDFYRLEKLEYKSEDNNGCSSTTKDRASETARRSD